MVDMETNMDFMFLVAFDLQHLKYLILIFEPYWKGSISEICDTQAGIYEVVARNSKRLVHVDAHYPQWRRNGWRRM
jgi:hypothetical protein